jgi:23S rRNA (uridine2552-2'-O)-methyltransferase
MRILDLGCAPGSWLQVAADLVGPQGRVVGLDLKPVKLALPPTVTTFEGDIFATPPEALTGPAGGLFHAVLSDMAPNTSGHGDAERSDELCRRILDLLPDLLMPTGSLVMKVLEGSPFPQLLKDSRAIFSAVKAYKPKASRDVSAEIFVIGQGYITKQE